MSATFLQLVFSGLALGAAYAMTALGFVAIYRASQVFNFAHGELLAFGAYAMTILTTQAGWSPWLGLPLGAIISGIIGTVIIYPALRVRGHYVAIATLGIGQIVAFTLLNWESLTRGPLGITNIPPITLFGVAIVRPAGARGRSGRSRSTGICDARAARADATPGSP